MEQPARIADGRRNVRARSAARTEEFIGGMLVRRK
jgi:hypothetical protein